MSRYTTVTNILFLKHILKYLYAIYFFKYYSRNKLFGNAKDNFRITELYISYFIDPWFGIETQLLIYSACLSLLSTNLYLIHAGIYLLEHFHSVLSTFTIIQAL